MAALIVDVPNTRARTRGGVPRPPPRPRIQLPTPALDAAPVIDTTRPVSNFVRTLYALAEGDYDDTQMEWIDGGDRILVADPKAFARDVCPRYYRHSKWTSFTRLMNMYNFRKCPAEEGTAFEHDYFKRGRAHDLHRVVRKRRGSDSSPVVTPPQEAHGDDAAMAERVRAAPRIPAPQQILEPEQTTVVSFTDEDEAPTPAQSPEQSYDALETNEAAQDAAQWRRRAADLERQVLALQRENAALRVGARPPWAADQAPAPGPSFGSSAALDANEQTASDLLFADDAIFDIGDDTKDENAWAWPDAFGLGCCLAPEPTTPATPGVRFVSKGKRQRVPDESDSGR